MRSICSFALWLSVLLCGIPTSVAWAQSAAQPESSAGDDVRARELYDNGVQLYSEGAYSEAVIAWSEAWRLSQRPLLLFNIAGALERLGDYEGAIDALNRYRALAPAGEREVLSRRIEGLRRRISREAEGISDDTPAPDPPPPAPRESAGPAGENSRGASPPIASGHAAELSARQLTGWTLLGVGAAGVITGGVFGVVALQARSDAESLCNQIDGRTLCPASARKHIDADRRSSTVADVGFVTGGVLAALGASLLLWWPEDTPALTPSPAPDGAGGSLLFRGAF